MDATTSLSEEEVELFVDVMVSKLSRLALYRTPQLPPGQVSRDEIRQVIVDTELLLTGQVSMDEFRDAG